MSQKTSIMPRIRYVQLGPYLQVAPGAVEVLVHRLCLCGQTPAATDSGAAICRTLNVPAIEFANTGIRITWFASWMLEPAAAT